MRWGGADLWAARDLSAVGDPLAIRDLPAAGGLLACLAGSAAAGPAARTRGAGTLNEFFNSLLVLLKFLGPVLDMGDPNVVVLDGGVPDGPGWSPAGR